MVMTLYGRPNKKDVKSAQIFIGGRLNQKLEVGSNFYRMSAQSKIRSRLTQFFIVGPAIYGRELI